MNILFVNYGDFTTNSLNHIAGFANTLVAKGHACIVAAARNRESISTVDKPLFIPATHADLLARPSLFPDNRPADIIHAWTPREGVRKFVVSYQKKLPSPARVIIHLEDNEEFLLSTYAARPYSELRAAPGDEIERIIVDGLPHPLRHRAFLAAADAITVITGRLREFVPPHIPAFDLPPGVDFDFYAPKPAEPALRDELGLGPNEKIITFTGSNTFANEPEMRELYVAIRLLNQRGVATRLIRTGFSHPKFTEGLPAELRKHVLDLGFVEKAKLPRLLALADVLVQPGRPGPFNDYRLPSKLPEFLASGRPVILPPTNLALEMADGRDGVFLKTGTPEEIADLCQNLFADKALATRIGAAGRAFARLRFDLQKNSTGLLETYEATLANRQASAWSRIKGSDATETTLLAAKVATEAAEQPALALLTADLFELTRQNEEGLAHQQAQASASLSRATHLEEELVLAHQHSRNLDKLLGETRLQLATTRELSEQHIKNLESAQRQHLQQLHEALRLAEQHAQNLQNKLNSDRTAFETSNAAAQQHLQNLESAHQSERLQLSEALRLAEQHAQNLQFRLDSDRLAFEDAQKLSAQHVHNLEQAHHNQLQQLSEALRLAEQHAQNLQLKLDSDRLVTANAQLLTKQHIQNLEDIIAQERMDAQTSRQRLENELRSTLADTQEKLRLTGQHAENLERALAGAQNSLRAAEGRVAETLAKLAEVDKYGREQASQLAHTRLQLQETERIARERVESAEMKVATLTDRAAHAEAVVRTRDEKISRIQQSFSWQVTSPLRALRRLFLDKPNPRPPVLSPATAGAPTSAATLSSAPTPGPTEQTLAQTPPPAPVPSVFSIRDPEPVTEPAPASYGYTYNFDHPRGWNTVSNKLLILGWCFENNGAPIKGLRARFGDEIVEGIYGSKRLDVLASVGGKKQAEYCGIKIDIKTTLGDHRLVVEVLHETGWNAFYETTVHVGKPGDPTELSEYEKWCEQHEALSADDLRGIEAHIARFAQRPLISVIMPTYNPPEALLVKAIESVRVQLYPNWELCIADDASTQPHVRTVLERFAQEDKRIKVTFREKNGHISAATNTAIELASGEWLALFDHDDVLHRAALYEAAAEIDAHPEAAFIYTDEDKIDGEDHRFDPYFKPDWNPDLLLGQNYTSHLSFFRTALVRSAGGLRLGYEGSQDWDLTLRIVESIPESAIRHIPKVLYHWRAIPGSTALQISEKSYPVDAARRALLDHFQRIGHTIELGTVPGDHWRVKYPLPKDAPLVSLIIPTRNALKLVRQAVESVVTKTTYPRYEILIVDNGSDDPATLAWFKDVQTTPPTAPVGVSAVVKVLRYDAPFNYSAINNFAVARAEGAVVGLLNNDVEAINSDWLEEMVSHALRPGIGAVGAMLYYPMNTVQHAGVILGLGGVAGHPFKEFPRGDQGQKNRLRLVQNYSAVTAACVVLSKAAFNAVGGLNEKNLAVAFNDVDLCCKLLAAGYRNVWTPFAELYHHESATRGIEDTPEKKARFQAEVDYMMETWGDLLADDPAYNPNLTLVGEDFSTAYLPRTQKPWLAKAGESRRQKVLSNAPSSR